jgi:hypothetical protein
MLFRIESNEFRRGSVLEAFNEKMFTTYGFGLVFIVMGIIIFIFGAQRTAEGAWDWQWLNAHNYILNGPGVALIIFCLVGTIFLLMGYKLEKLMR